MNAYLDWRIAFAAAEGADLPPDFDEAALIALDAWEKVVEYVEQAWQMHLLPNVCEGTLS